HELRLLDGRRPPLHRRLPRSGGGVRESPGARGVPEKRVESMNAGEMLTTTATSYPDRVAWIWDAESGTTRTRTYGESNRRADALAFALVDFGVERGDRVALFM